MTVAIQSHWYFVYVDNHIHSGIKSAYADAKGDQLRCKKLYPGVHFKIGKILKSRFTETLKVRGIRYDLEKYPSDRCAYNAKVRKNRIAGVKRNIGSQIKPEHILVSRKRNIAAEIRRKEEAARIQQNKTPVWWSLCCNLEASVNKFFNRLGVQLWNCIDTQPGTAVLFFALIAILIWFVGIIFIG